MIRTRDSGQKENDMIDYSHNPYYSSENLIVMMTRYCQSERTGMGLSFFCKLLLRHHETSLLKNGVALLTTSKQSGKETVEIVCQRYDSSPGKNVLSPVPSEVREDITPMHDAFSCNVLLCSLQLIRVVWRESSTHV